MNIVNFVALIIGGIIGFLACWIAKREMAPTNRLVERHYEEYWLHCEVGSVLIQRDTFDPGSYADSDDDPLPIETVAMLFTDRAAKKFQMDEYKVIVNGVAFEIEVKRLTVTEILQTFSIPTEVWARELNSLTKHYKEVNHVGGTGQ